MHEPQNLDVIKQIYAAFGRGDLPGMLTWLHPDVSWITPGSSELPTAGKRRGHSEVMAFFGALVAMVDIVRFAPHDFLAQGDKVVVLGDEECRVKANGASVVNRWVHIFTVSDGMVVAFEEVLDTAPLAAALQTARAPA
jgi:ketosteroid isomerase-like protein